MNFTVDKKIFNLFPELALGVLVIHNSAAIQLNPR